MKKILLILVVLAFSLNAISQDVVKGFKRTYSSGADTIQSFIIENPDSLGKSGFIAIRDADTMRFFIDGDTARINSNLPIAVNGSVSGGGGGVATDTTNLSDSLRLVTIKVDSLINNSVNPVTDTLTAYNCDTLYVSDYIELNGTYSITQSITLLDDGILLLPEATNGIVSAMLGDNVYFANFSYATDGSSIISYSHGAVFNAASGDGLQIYDTGNYVAIKNTSGGVLDLLVNGIRLK